MPVPSHIRRWLVATLCLALLAAASVTAHTSGQAEKPTFKGSVSALPFNIVVKDKAGKPRVGLGAADFTLTIDGKPREFADLSEAPDRPGTYLMIFEPAKADRDGKDHRLEIAVRGGGTLKKTFKLPKE